MIVLIILIMVPLIAFFLARQPSVQNWIAGKASIYLTERLGTEVKIGSARLSFFDELILRDVHIMDQHHETLAELSEAIATISLLDLRQPEIRIRKLEIDSVYFNLVKYPGENELNLKFILDSFRSSDTTKPQLDFHLTRLTIEHGTFNYHNHNKAKAEGSFGIDWNNLSLRSIRLDLDGIKIYDDSIQGIMKHLEFKEKSGLILEKLSGIAHFGDTAISMEMMTLKTPSSLLRGEVNFLYDSIASLNQFTSKVKTRSSFQTSTLNMSDIAYFAPELEGIDKRILFNGDVFGTVRQLRGRDIYASLGRHTTFEGSVDINGLPQVRETYMRLEVRKLITHKSDLDSIPLPPFREKRMIKTPDNFYKLGRIRFEGEFLGFFNDFVAYGLFNTALGNIRTDLSLKLDSVSARSSYSGNMALLDFDAGSFFEQTWLGRTTASAEIKGSGFSAANIAAELNGKFNYIDINGYRYQNALAEGSFSNRLFEGELKVNDPNLVMNFNGTVDLTGKLPVYNFQSDVSKANLATLNIVDRDSSSRISTSIQINLTGNSFDNIVGQLQLTNTSYHEQGIDYHLNRLMLSASEKDNFKTLAIASDYLDLTLSGEYNIAHLPNSFKALFLEVLDSNMFQPVATGLPIQNFNFQATMKNLGPITQLFYPKLQVARGAEVHGHFRSNAGDFQINGESDFISFHGFRFADFSFDGATHERQFFDFHLKSDRVHLSDSLWIDDLFVKTITSGDSVALDLGWDNQSTPRQSADIHGIGRFDKLDSFVFHFFPSVIYVGDTLWTLNGKNSIHGDSSGVTINELALRTESQSMEITGVISDDPAKKLNLVLSDFRLANFNPLTTKEKVTLGGSASGIVSLGSLRKNPSVTSSLNLSQFEFNQEKIGNGQINSTWNEKDQSILLDARLYRDTLTITHAVGSYYPFKKSDNLDVALHFNKIRLYLLNPFFDGILSNINGIASGTVYATGTINEPKLKGNLDMQRTTFTVDYTNTSYSFNGPLRVEPTWFGFDNLTLFDVNGNRGSVTGTVFHKNFREFNLDLLINGEKMMALNTNQSQNSLYYGTAYYTGSLVMSGPANQLLFELKGRTESGTKLNFPLGDAEEITANTFIRFVNKDTLRQADSILQESNTPGPEVVMEIDMTPDAEIFLIFDPAVGDVMRGTGSGRLNMGVSRNGDFSIYGRYTIEAGEYLFTLMNVINKRFDVEQGGTIDFNGTVDYATINVDAVYRLRTSLDDLGNDIALNSGQRYPVETILHLTNDLMQPDISFDIVLPSADEGTRAAFASIMANEEERNRQTFALLTMNHFVAPQTMSGTISQTNYTNVVGTSSSELLSNQLSNWLSQISNDFDLGVKYRPGDDITNEELEIAFGTQVFNDRVIIDGNFGISGNNNNSNVDADANTLIDGTIEYKINKEGNLRVKAFNKPDPYRLENSNNMNRQGVGLFYRLEFDNIKELWNDKIKKAFRKRREADEVKPAGEPTQNEQTDEGTGL